MVSHARNALIHDASIVDPRSINPMDLEQFGTVDPAWIHHGSAMALYGSTLAGFHCDIYIYTGLPETDICCISRLIVHLALTQTTHNQGII